MRVLITAHALDAPGGVQTYVRDLAAWLLARGHTPVVYGPDHGPTAVQLLRLTIPFTDDLATIAVAPDIIHGNSSVETMTALLHFSETPAIFVCHGWKGELGRPPRFPRILRCLAVDDTSADRLIFEEGVPPERVTVLLNAVDMARFPARATPLPPRPKRALVFGNGAHAMRDLPVVEEACRRAGIGLDVVSDLAGTSEESPETILGQYDLVFAKAKCAMEGMASGAAVILLDGSRFGGMVSSADVVRLRRLNFGIRALDQPLSLDALSRAIAGYDPKDAAEVSALIRDTASSEILHGQLLSLYESVIDEHASKGARSDWKDESRAAAAYLRHITTTRRTPEADFKLVVQTAHRILQAPVIGPALTRMARWVTRKRKGESHG